MRWLLGLLGALAVAFAADAQDEPRLALLIGNEDYPAAVGRLSLPHEDVEVMAEALGAVGFDVVAVLDADEDDMERAIAAFATRLDNAGPEAAGFLYYAGHGASTMVSGRRRNFLLPARENITNATELRIHGLRLDEIVSALADTRAGAVFVVADACRNTLTWSESMGGGRGFGVEPARTGVIVAQSTAEDELAPDDGAFARALAENIRAPGQYASRSFELAYREVARSRDAYRQPTTQGALARDFCFASCPGQGDENAAAPDPARALWETVEGSDDVLDYTIILERYPDSHYADLASNRIQRLTAAALASDATGLSTPGSEASIDDIREFLVGRWLASFEDMHPTGELTLLADGQSISRGEGSGPPAPWSVYRDGERLLFGIGVDPSADPERLEIIDRNTLSLPQREVTLRRLNDAVESEIEAGATDQPTDPIARAVAAVEADGPIEDRVFRDPLRSGGEGPEMVVIPAGSFTMGSPASEAGRERDEGPQRSVTIPRAFAVGRYEIARGQFAAFVRATGHNAENGCVTDEDDNSRFREGRNWRLVGFFQNDSHPLVCVSWDDARRYVDWLSAETDETYRLLTEAEWEYAARAGAVTAYSWGHSPSYERANFGSDRHCCNGLAAGSDRWVNTAPVGSFPANAFGLYDMHGNVWEWVEDLAAANYDGAPTNGSARTSSNWSTHVIRGGSWKYSSRYMRSATRGRRPPESRSNELGFRVARDLD